MMMCIQIYINLARPFMFMLLPFGSRCQKYKCIPSDISISDRVRELRCVETSTFDMEHIFALLNIYWHEEI